MNKLNVQLQGKNQFIDDIWSHLKSFKQKLVLFADQLAKNDLYHFARLNSTTLVKEDKLGSYENELRYFMANLKKGSKTSVQLNQIWKSSVCLLMWTIK